jgi:hypothetical protein
LDSATQKGIEKFGSLYIFGYIIAIVVGFGGLISGRRPWSEAGIKRAKRRSDVLDSWETKEFHSANVN